MPLSALATTLVRDPQLLVVNVFEPSVRGCCCSASFSLDMMPHAHCISFSGSCHAAHMLSGSYDLADARQRGECHQELSTAAESHCGGRGDPRACTQVRFCCLILLALSHVCRSGMIVRL